MIDLSDPLNLSEHAKTRIIQQITMLKIFEVKPHIIDAVLQQDWVAVCEERKCFDAFFHTCKDWNIHRKDQRQRKAKAEEDRINLLNLLSK